MGVNVVGIHKTSVQAERLVGLEKLADGRRGCVGMATLGRPNSDQRFNSLLLPE